MKASIYGFAPWNHTHSTSWRRLGEAGDALMPLAPRRKIDRYSEVLKLHL